MEKVYIKEKYTCSKIDSYLRPEFIYIPVDSSKYLVGDYIYKNDIIIDNIYSPISGYVREDIYMDINNKKTNCMVIENDYKEKCRKNNYVFEKEVFIDSLKSNGLIDIYDNYDIRYLVINAIDIEPYIFSKRVYIDRDASNLLCIINCIMMKLNIMEGIIAITSDMLYDNLFNYIGTYPNIRIIKVDNYYPVGNNRLLLKEIFNIKYNITCLEKKIWVTDILSLIDIDSIIKKNIPKNETIITIGGAGIKNTCLKVKIGTSIMEIINYLGGYKDNYIITIGGPLTGKRINGDTIIMNDTKSIFVTKNNIIKEKECNLCGKCIGVCPVNLIPIFIMKNINKENYLNKLNIDKCIDCSLCSYICPSNINLKDYIDKAKGVIKSE